MDLALFDFDGTITTHDTFRPFLSFAGGRARMAVGTALLGPMLVGYELGWIHASRMRAAAAYLCCRGRPERELRELGARYGQTLTRWFRPEALERIRWHKERGDTVVVVSASLRPYLEDLCRGLELELVCTELEARGGVLTGRYLGGDCTGPEKARRVRAAHDLARYTTIHAYGDTREDAELLELATRRYYRWRELPAEGGVLRERLGTARSEGRTRTRGRCLVGYVAALGACWPGLARASDLSWSGPADCARSEQLMFEVERALGAPLAETGRVHLQVHVARTAPTARALLRIDDADESAISERRLVAPDCDKLVDTLAVAITLAIEAAAPPRLLPSAPAAVASEPARVEPPPAASAVDAANEATPRDRPPTDATAARGPVPLVIARLLGDLGSLPAPAFGVGVGARLAWPRWHLELSGTLWGDGHAQIDTATTPGAGADLSLVTGALAACALPLEENSAIVVLCASWEMGRLSGQGTGITSPRRASGLWLAPGIEAGFTWRPADSRLGIGARLGATAPLGQRSFYLERIGTVHEVESLVARASLSVEVAL